MSSDCQVPNIVHIFWHGSPLPHFQQYALRSWMNMGWVVNYWTYNAEDTPVGAVYRDASTLQPVEDVYSISQGYASNSIAAFSDLMRYSILSEEPGLWSDADNFCLRPYSEWAEMMSSRRIVCGEESNGPYGEFSVNVAILAFPDRAMAAEARDRCVRVIDENNRQLPQWAQIGPKLMTSLIGDLGLRPDVMPIRAFYPIGGHDHRRTIEPSERDDLLELIDGSYSFHFWNSQFAPYSELTEVAPPSESLMDWAITTLCY